MFSLGQQERGLGKVHLRLLLQVCRRLEFGKESGASLGLLELSSVDAHRND